MTSLTPNAAATPRVKCLIVDDSEDNLLVLAALLELDGVEVLSARSGRDALELLLEHDVALALLDVRMPEMDGFELAELMRGSERTSHVPIIFVTAGLQDDQRVFRGYDSGAVDFLHKPINPAILRNKAGVFFELHRQRQRLARELEERTETLRFNEMFVAVLGHDLRNPLHAILLNTTLLSRSADAATQAAAARIESAGKRMMRMISDTLDLARARIGNGIAIAREAADLLVLAQKVVAEHQSASPQRRIEIDFAGDLRGDWDPGRLSQVISNLIGNALQHGSQAPVVLSLDGTQSARVRLTVTNGGDIPASLLDCLFDPFRSGQAYTERQGGLGLGLYIVQQITQAHGGTVAVSSDKGEVRFAVELPRGALG